MSLDPGSVNSSRIINECKGVILWMWHMAFGATKTPPPQVRQTKAIIPLCNCFQITLVEEWEYLGRPLCHSREKKGDIILML